MDNQMSNEEMVKEAVEEAKKAAMEAEAEEAAEKENDKEENYRRSTMISQRCQKSLLKRSLIKIFNIFWNLLRKWKDFVYRRNNK